MIEDLLKEQLKLQKRVDGIVAPELSPDLISPFLSIPGLVGFWPMSSVQRSTGNVYDLSGQGRTLTYNGNPAFNVSNLAPYIALDGVGDYFSRADETDLDILGTETIYAAAQRGLTVGGWFWSNAYIATNQVMMSKLNTPGQISWRLIFRRSGLGNDISFIVSTDGTNEVSVISGVAYGVAAWHFIVGRFVPSTSIVAFIDGVSYTQLVGVPASIFNSTSALNIGNSVPGVEPLAGRASLCFLSANALSDAKISSLYQQTRGAFGV